MRGHDGAVPQVAAAPVEAVAVDEEEHRQPGALNVACRETVSRWGDSFIQFKLNTRVRCTVVFRNNMT